MKQLVESIEEIDYPYQVTDWAGDPFDPDLDYPNYIDDIGDGNYDQPPEFWLWLEESCIEE